MDPGFERKDISIFTKPPTGSAETFPVNFAVLRLRIRPAFGRICLKFMGKMRPQLGGRRKRVKRKPRKREKNLIKETKNGIRRQINLVAGLLGVSYGKL